MKRSQQHFGKGSQLRCCRGATLNFGSEEHKSKCAYSIVKTLWALIEIQLKPKCQGAAMRYCVKMPFR